MEVGCLAWYSPWGYTYKELASVGWSPLIAIKRVSEDKSADISYLGVTAMPPVRVHDTIDYTSI